MVIIALKTSASQRKSHHALTMGIELAASSIFLSHIYHPSNELVVGAGEYCFSDYQKVGVPLTLIVLPVLIVIMAVCLLSTP